MPIRIQKMSNGLGQSVCHSRIHFDSTLPSRMRNDLLQCRFIWWSRKDYKENFQTISMHITLFSQKCHLCSLITNRIFCEIKSVNRKCDKLSLHECVLKKTDHPVTVDEMNTRTLSRGNKIF